MASATILNSSAPYYTILVEFGEQQFEQTVICLKTGAQLTTFLQGYADKYESDWLALQPSAEPEPS